jgi:hypothetical protein
MNWRKAYLIPEFCEEVRIKHSYFYEMQKLGRGPKVTVLPGGKKKIITGEHAAEWVGSLPAIPSDPALASSSSAPKVGEAAE